MKAIYTEIADERARQDEQWGGPDHDAKHWSSEWRDYRNKFENRAEANDNAPEIQRDALLKIAALAVAQIEALDARLVTA